MTTAQRDDVEQEPKGHGGECCGGSGNCGGRRKHGGHHDGETQASTSRAMLEHRQRDLEQELADVTGQLRDLGNQLT